MQPEVGQSFILRSNFDQNKDHMGIPASEGIWPTSGRFGEHCLLKLALVYLIPTYLQEFFLVCGCPGLAFMLEPC